MPRGRPKSALVLTTVERETLEGWVQASGTSQALSQRAAIVLACTDGDTNASVASALGLTAQTVGKWRERFVEKRLAGLSDAPRSGAPPRICPGDVAWVLNLTLLAKPCSSPRWSARSLSAVCGMSPSSISRIWRGFGLRPGSMQPAHRRSDARATARFERLAQLYFDADRRKRVRVHGAKCVHGLRDWLTRCDATVPEDTRADLILCACGVAAEAEARDWQTARPRFDVHFAPPGPLWPDAVVGWFRPEAGAPAGMARIQDHLREELASGAGFEGGMGSYVWSAGGERFLHTVAALL